VRPKTKEASKAKRLEARKEVVKERSYDVLTTALNDSIERSEHSINPQLQEVYGNTYQVNTVISNVRVTDTLANRGVRSQFRTINPKHEVNYVYGDS